MDDTYDDFLEGYIACALWSSTDDDGEPLDREFGRDDIHPDARDAMEAACREFIEAAGHLLDGADAEQAGHDFWLTRNRHGAGFWDRKPSQYPNDPQGKQLTELAHSYGTCDLYLDDTKGEVHAY